MPTLKKQRLAIFLDGTWNTEDDSTNVLHAYNMAMEGLCSDGCIQKRYYDRGVGTGVFESISGGGFGLGLEINVREAYNWLVDNYNDKDEIYVFGFSRGAYTARSLVSFISSCGLVERGAPLTVSQLWKGYTFISQNRSNTKKDWWKKALAKNKYCFRRITKLKRSGWSNSKTLNHTEELIKDWSRRVDISFLGIYDTVGAIGIEALGIPGLSGRLAESHNQYPSSIIQHCRHALAIDECRGSFRLTPFLDYVPNGKPKDEQGYDKKIIQKWFIGAHSNIGGGYPNNNLSIIPMNWLMEGAEEVGLVKDNLFQKVMAPSVLSEEIRDSFAEFSGPLWPHLLREKRHFRPIDRPDLVRSGYTLRTINEHIDESVLEYASSNSAYAPPHLLAHAQGSDDAALKAIFEGRQPVHEWPSDSTWWAFPVLILWAMLAASGIKVISQIFWLDGFPLGPIGLSLLAIFFVIADWGESRTNLIKTLRPNVIILRTVWNIMFWGRLLGAFAFMVGTAFLVIDLLGMVRAWNLELFIDNMATLIADWNVVLLFTTAVVFLLAVFEKYVPVVKVKAATVPKEKVETFSAEPVEDKKILTNIAILLSLGAFVASLVKCKDYSFGLITQGQEEQFAGLLLLMFVLIFAFIKSLDWVGKPMSASRAGLGSILRLQSKYTKSQIAGLFNEWLRNLSRFWVAPEIRDQLTWARMKEILREALWRDLLGFIPIYSLVLGSILYIGATKMNFCYLAGFDCTMSTFAGLPLWLVLILVTALADVAENMIHLRHIKNHPAGGSSNGLVFLGALFTMIKFLGFFSAMLMAIVIFCVLSWEVVTGAVGEWRWLSGTVISCLVFLSLLLSGIRFLRKYFSTKSSKQEAEA